MVDLRIGGVPSCHDPREEKLEIDALVGAVIEFAELTETPVPRIETVYALTALLDATNRETSAHEAAPATRGQ